MSNKRASVDQIQDAINEFTDGLPELEKKNFNEVYAILKDLSLDSEGKIKATIENLKIINKVQNKLNSLIDNPKYESKVEDLQAAIGNVSKVQTLYFSTTFKDFTKPRTIDKLQDLTFDSVVDQLKGAGINENVLNQSAEIVESHIRDGSNFYTMVDELKVKMLGDKKIDSKLVSYAKQIINDTLSSFSRNFHTLVTQDLDLQWFVYIGALVDTSRPFCRALVHKQYIHKSELAKIARGDIDGKQISKEGLFPNTNGENLINNCGGYNCSHQMIPVSDVVVPTEIRRQFEPDIKPDNAEKSNSRPKRK